MPRRILPDPIFFGIDGLILGKLIVGLVVLIILVVIGYHNEAIATKVLGVIIFLGLAYFFLKNNN